MPKDKADNANGKSESDKDIELEGTFDLTFTNEEGMLLLTSARLLDKLVAGVTIHAQEKDQLIKDIIDKLSKRLPREITRVSNELADAIVESVLGEGEGDDEDFPSDVLCLNMSDEEYLALRRDIAEEVMGDDFEPDRDLSSLNGMFKEKFAKDMASDPVMSDFPMYSTDKTMPVLEHALIKHHSVRVAYYSFAREAVDTVNLDPLVIVKEQNLWRMVAYCHERHETLIFRVDRIKEIIETDSRFSAPANVSQISYSRLPVYS